MIYVVITPKEKKCLELKISDHESIVIKITVVNKNDLSKYNKNEFRNLLREKCSQASYYYSDFKVLSVALQENLMYCVKKQTIREKKLLILIISGLQTNLKL